MVHFSFTRRRNIIITQECTSSSLFSICNNKHHLDYNISHCHSDSNHLRFPWWKLWEAEPTHRDLSAVMNIFHWTLLVKQWKKKKHGMSSRHFHRISQRSTSMSIWIYIADFHFYECQNISHLNANILQTTTKKVDWTTVSLLNPSCLF